MDTSNVDPGVPIPFRKEMPVAPVSQFPDGTELEMIPRADFLRLVKICLSQKMRRPPNQLNQAMGAPFL